MRNYFLVALAAGAACLLGCSSNKQTPSKSDEPAAAEQMQPAPAGPLTAEDSVLVTAKATVTAIDYKSREITLLGDRNDEVTFVVDKRVQRLSEIKVGDRVKAEYYISITGELRAPTPDEAAHPAVVVVGTARAPKGTAPAADELKAFRVVTTIDAIDLGAQTVTLKGPRGNEMTVRARSRENLKKMKVGDTIVVTYTEALAISVQKDGW